MASNAHGLLLSEEYERRRMFLDNLKILTKAEYVEIARILVKHNVIFSENSNGIFFNVGLLEQEVFDTLIKFIEFTQFNRRDLAIREQMMSSLKTEMKLVKSES